MDVKQYGAEPAYPFSAYEETVQVKPRQHSGLTKHERVFLAALTGFCAGLPTESPSEIVGRAIDITTVAVDELAELARGAE